MDGDWPAIRKWVLWQDKIVGDEPTIPMDDDLRKSVEGLKVRVLTAWRLWVVWERFDPSGKITNFVNNVAR
jgi:hypothetical protein